MKKIALLISILALLLLIIACSGRVTPPIPDRVDIETDENGLLIGVYEIFLGANSREEIYKEANEKNELVVKWVLKTVYNDDGDPTEERFTHEGLLSSIKRFSFENEASSRENGKKIKIEYFSESGELRHIEERQYDISERLIRTDHSDNVYGETLNGWHVEYYYEKDQANPYEERIFSDSSYVNPYTNDGTLEVYTYTYREDGLLTEKRIATDGAHFGKIILYEYDMQNHLIQETYLIEAETEWIKTYLYDGDILLSIELRDAGGNLIKKRTID